jgi:hypothetical protein
LRVKLKNKLKMMKNQDRTQHMLFLKIWGSYEKLAKEREMSLEEFIINEVHLDENLAKKLIEKWNGQPSG